MTIMLSFQKNAYESLKGLPSWVQDLRARVEFFRGWLESAVSLVEQTIKAKAQGLPLQLDDVTRLYPISYWLPAFYFPQGIEPDFCFFFQFFGRK